MSKKDRSIANSRCESQRIYYQRCTIKRLQQENQQLKEENENLITYKTEHIYVLQENADLQDRINKAIEYIENDLKSFLYSVEYKKLLEILKGE